ncbi:MAG: response regulator transcription factor [Clostridiales bacterium]|nr:response regulator transcription factor [Clostridiales bacterium]
MIYLVEDDESIRELVVYTLKTQGLDAKGFEKPSLFWKAMEKERPSLLLLDIMLPEEDGIAVLKKIRIHPDTRRLPVIMLTARGSEYDTVVGLDSGADDYIPKPFRMMELISRIRALLRRTQDSGAEEYQVGELYVCPSRHVVTVNKEPVSLTLKEYEMLCLLLKNSGTVLSRTQLLNQIWGYEFDGESRTVDVHVRTLRQKLGRAGEIVETVRGVGYKISGKTKTS